MKWSFCWVYSYILLIIKVKAPGVIPVVPISNTPLALGLPTMLWDSQVQVPQNQFLFHLFLKLSNALKSTVIQYQSFLSHLRVSLSSSSDSLVLIEKFGNDVPVLIFYFLCKSLLLTDLCFLSGWLCGKLTSSHPPWNESASQRLKRELASFCLQLCF